MNNNNQKDASRPGEELAGKRVLVTGATGFVGSHLTRRLCELGADTSILVRKTSDAKLVGELEKAGARIFFGDISDQEQVNDAADGAEYIFHIAALFRQAKHPDSIYYDVNVEGTRHVINAAEKNNAERLVHCSTVGVHSHILNPPASESEEYRPGDIYQLTKCEGEKLVQQAIEQERLKGVVVRPAMIWGDGDKRMLKLFRGCLLYTSPSPRDATLSRMPSSA